MTAQCTEGVKTTSSLESGKRKRLLLPKIKSPHPVATGWGECGACKSHTALGLGRACHSKGILIGKGWGSWLGKVRDNSTSETCQSRPSCTTLPAPIVLHQEITYIFWSSSFWNLSSTEPYAEMKARVKAFWEFSSGDEAGLVLSSCRCRLCIFPYIKFGTHSGLSG